MKKIKITLVSFIIILFFVCSVSGQTSKRDSLFGIRLNEIICKSLSLYMQDIKEKRNTDSIDFITVLNINTVNLKKKTAEFSISEIIDRYSLDILYPRECIKCNGIVSIIKYKSKFEGLQYISFYDIDFNTMKFIYSFYPNVGFTTGEPYTYYIKVKNKKIKSLKKYY